MADTKAPYGDVPYGDPGYLDADGNQVSKSGKPGVKRYPLTADKVKAAWSYINQEKNASQYTAEQLSAIKGKIRSAMAEHGHEVSSDGDGKGDGGGRSMLERVPVERRYTRSPVECRAVAEGKHITGYAAVFHTPANPVMSRNLGGFVERVMPTAFNQARMAGFPGMVCRYNHDGNMLLGTIAGRTLDLEVDGTGLRYDVLPPQSRADILELVGRGDVQHSSFAFRCPAGGDEWSMTEQNYPVRSLIEVQGVDVAPVVDPAYPDATAGLRSLAEHFGADPDEVRQMAQADELRRFFVRTDIDGGSPRRRPRMLGAAAAATLLERRFDPFIDED